MCNEKYLLWFLVGYDFNPVHVFSIPLQKRRDRKHTKS